MAEDQGDVTESTLSPQQSDAGLGGRHRREKNFLSGPETVRSGLQHEDLESLLMASRSLLFFNSFFHQLCWFRLMKYFLFAANLACLSLGYPLCGCAVIISKWCS